MLKKNNQTIGTIYKGSTPIEKIYKGGILVWEGWKTLIAQGIPPISLQKCANKNLVGYQIYGNSKQGELPDGYTQLEYIESTGTQYIDTGITATDNTGMSIKYCYTADGPAGVSGIFKSGGSRQDVFFISTQTGSLPGQAFVAHNGFTSQTSLPNVVLNTDYTMKINYNNDGKIYYNDDYVGDVGTLGLYNSTIPLFARYSVSGRNYSVSNSRIYYVEFTEGSEISHKFIPAKNSSGIIGMYDLVNNVFYENAGTGTFTAGAEMPNPTNPIEIQSVGDNETGLPLGYTQLDYIESTGEQYIDTNYIPNSKTKIQANVAFTEDTGSMQNFGAIANLGTSSKVNYARWHFGVFSNKLCVFRENTTQSGDIKLDYDDAFHTYEITNTSCSLDDTTKDITLYTNSDVSFVLFARNGYTSAGGTPSITAYSKSKLKTFKIYEDNVLVKNFVPCKNTSDVVGMYDTVGKRFYGSETSTPLVAGEEIAKGGYKIPVSVTDTNNITTTTNIYLAEPLRKIGNADAVILPSGYTQLEYIETDGNQYIDTGAKISSNNRVIMDLQFTDVSTTQVNGGFFRYSNHQMRNDIGLTTSTGMFFIGVSNQSVTTNVVADTNRHIFEINSKTGEWGIDNTTGSVTPSTIGDSDDVTFHIGIRQYKNGSEFVYEFPCSEKIYSCKIYYNDILIRNMIPCKNTSDVIGMYDLVNGVFYSNQGTGTFTAGPVIYADYIDFENQKVVRNVGSKIFNGSENYWGNQTIGGEQRVVSVLKTDISTDSTILPSLSSLILSNRFRVSTAPRIINIGQVYSGINYVNFNLDDTNDIDVFKAWLSNNNVELIYPIETTEESIELPDILLNKGTNVIDVETSLKPSNLWLKYKGKE